MSGLSDKFLSLKIGTKIAAAVGILFLMLAATGGFALRGIGNVQEASEDIAKNWLPSIQETGYLRFAISRHRTLVIRHLVASDPAAKTATDQELVDIATQIQKHRAIYEPMISTAAENAAYRAFAAAFETYLQSAERTLDHSRRGDMEGGAIVWVDAGPIFVAADKGLSDVIDANEAGAAQSARTADEVAALVRLKIAIFIASAIVLSVLICWLLVATVSRPVVAMTQAMRRLADKDMTAEIPAMGRSDEIGLMAAAVQVFKDNMQRADTLEAAAATERAAREARAAKVLKLTQNFDAAARKVVGALSSSATAMQSSAKAMTQTAESTSQQATAVAAASEQASTNVQTVASSAEELSASIQEISRRVAESATISKSAVDQADRTTATVQSLVAVAAKIGDVTKLINDIASQTNLLALNATIEAARAGDAGKGFAVVASEVKGLASQTSRATDEISEQISAIQSASADTVKAIGEITTTIRTINEIAAAIAAAVEEQGAATQEIARNVQQASAGTSEVSSNIAGVTKAAADTGHAADQVNDGAVEISNQASLLKREVDGFLDGVRAA
jgi:methyl-accepting chemotaxis protein